MGLNQVATGNGNNFRISMNFAQNAKNIEYLIR